ncbi:amidase [Aeromicrobium wangtongii]|uniref:Amidase n=1 Tax=Aeromicrobium wangtongii TaxID=2969247 RepID=A0ABY5MH71_9ACTN|nr:amidase [Aeromicrobium wangtongii]MCD9197753.1 amidase [Aeromicrobium wangtongii]UUP15236.1 amidase [Aeromicrobium wangtongii]
MDEAINSVITWVEPGETAAGPLAGLTLGVKDNIDVGGVRSTCASTFFADRVADEDATVVRRLRAAGAAVVATLNLAEFAVGVTSQNSAAGGPRNPWDPRRVPAGSSGGSGAAVAAGLVDIALGTDSGGSVRLPAAACGVVGLRPTPGILDMTGVFPVSPDFDTVGPMARTVDLVARTFDVLCETPRSTRPAPRRVGVPRRFVTDDVDPDVARAVADFVQHLGDLGLEVVEIDIPLADEAQSHVYTLLYHDLAQLHRERLEEPERFQPPTLQRIRQGVFITADQHRAAARARSDFRAGMRQVLESVDVVVTPTLPVDVPFAREEEAVLTQSVRLGQLSYPWSLHNGPTMSLPVGFHAGSGMPVGAQLTAAHCDEEALFTIGRLYQSETDWHTRRPPVCL